VRFIFRRNFSAARRPASELHACWLAFFCPLFLYSPTLANERICNFWLTASRALCYSRAVLLMVERTGKQKKIFFSLVLTKKTQAVE
jgi:hypothetical protein